ncbi:MAG: NAD(P)H-dependent oxidoreductase [Candidatus Hermodarchaeia archaeon]|jgi:NAD(P)H dehydrogenase (quinone)
MNVLIVYAHPNPKSFNHAVLDSFTKGLKDGGHSFDVVDLYAEKFNPSIQLEDFGQFAGKPMPEEVQNQQERLAKADALVFVCPALGWFVPAILEGWIQRVFSWGFALTQKKGLYIFTTGNPEAYYQGTGLGPAMTKILGMTLTESGIKDVDFLYLYFVSGVDDATRKKYLEQVYQKGKEF